MVIYGVHLKIFSEFFKVEGLDIGFANNNQSSVTVKVEAETNINQIFLATRAVQSSSYLASLWTITIKSSNAKLSL